MMAGEKGSALVSVVVGATIMIAVVLAAATLFARGQVDLQAADEKMEMDTLRDYLHNSLRVGQVCDHLLTQAGAWNAPLTMPLTFSAAAVGTASPPVISLNSIPSSTVVGAPNVIQVGTGLPSMPSLVVQSIRLQVTQDFGASFGAKMLISFQAGSGRSYRPLEVPVSILVSGAATKTILSCQSEAGSANGIETLIISTSTTFVVPSGVSELKVTVVGGGGGGGGGYSSNNVPGETTCIGGGGGGGGGSAVCSLPVVPGDSIPVVVGAGGIGGVGSGPAASLGVAASGGNGGATSFGTVCSAGGGAGGTPGTPGLGIAGSTPSAGGAGGLGILGDVLVGGTPGEPGKITPWCGDRDLYAEFGFGGSSYGTSRIWGGGGPGGDASGSVGNSGRNGKTGTVILEWVK